MVSTASQYCDLTNSGTNTLSLYTALQVVFELLCNLDLIPEWDMLYKGAKYLNFIRDPAGRCEVGYIHLVYGLPGMSNDSN